MARKPLYMKCLSALGLLSWQALVAIAHTVTNVDAVIAAWPDPVGYVAIMAILLAPPRWLSFLAIAAAIALLMTTWHQSRHPDNRLSEPHPT